jgi:hypothetical protein
MKVVDRALEYGLEGSEDQTPAREFYYYRAPEVYYSFIYIL